MTASQRSKTTRSAPRRVLIAGGGIAGLETLLALRHFAGDRVRIEMLSRAERFHYRALDVAQPFGMGGTRHLDMAELVTSAGGHLHRGTLQRVDTEGKQVLTEEGEHLGYDALVIATGARALPVLDDALTFRGEPDLESFRALLAAVRSDEGAWAFVRPKGASWALPLYELAFLTATDLACRNSSGRIELVVLTHEAEPLQMFGPAVSAEVRVLLERDGIALRTDAEVVDYRDGVLRLFPSGEYSAARVVSMPRLRGRAIEGLPRDRDDFVPVDAFGRVTGVTDVYAAGDATNYPIKQGGLAGGQADAVATVLAAWAGVPMKPRPFRPVLRAQLLTSGAPRFFEAELEEDGKPSTVRFHPPSWPSAKIAAEFLTPFLAERGVGDPIGWSRTEAVP